MEDSDKSISSKDSKNLSDSKLTNESNKNQISMQEIIDNQFDEVENWVEEQFDNIKKDCLKVYNNFNVKFPNSNSPKKDINIDNNDD